MRILDFFQHVLSATYKSAGNSLFLQEFYTGVLKGKDSTFGRDIDKLRRKLCHSKERISFQDFGAKGGIEGTFRHTTVGKIARSSARRRFEGEFLKRLCAYYQPKKCLELGTNLGISTLYQALPLKDSTFITLEGAPTILKIARDNFQTFNLDVFSIEGEFDISLGKVDLKTFKPDYVFIDGNHRYEATMRYFERIYPFMEEGGIMLFDDIYWSKGMKNAWNEIIRHKDVSISIDLFFFGLCFVKKRLPKKHVKFRLI